METADTLWLEMQRVSFLVLVGFSLILSACTTSIPPETVADVGLSGRIAILDSAGSVFTVDPTGEERTVVAAAAEDVRRFQPIWSPAGSSLAWSEESVDGPAVVVADDKGQTTRIPSQAFPFYLNWAPNGATIGGLMNGAPGDLDLVLFDIASSDGEVLDSGSPFYFSWSPDSRAIVARIGDETVRVYDESGTASELGDTASGYLAPVWTDAGIIYRNPTGIVVVDNVDAGRLLAESPAFLNFTANSAGSLLAVQPLTGAAPQGLTVGLGVAELLETDVVSVVDVASGDLSVASEGVAIGMFWSPDGMKLLMPVVASAEGDVDMVVWEDGESSTVGRLRLSAELVSTALQFGDQYAQSWEVWSPESTAFVFPGAIEGNSGIWVLGVGMDPTRVSNGTWASWSSS